MGEPKPGGGRSLDAAPTPASSARQEPYRYVSRDEVSDKSEARAFVEHLFDKTDKTVDPRCKAFLLEENAWLLDQYREALKSGDETTIKEAVEMMEDALRNWDDGLMRDAASPNVFPLLLQKIAHPDQPLPEVPKHYLEEEFPEGSPERDLQDVFQFVEYHTHEYDRDRDKLLAALDRLRRVVETK